MLNPVRLLLSIALSLSFSLNAFAIQRPLVFTEAEPPVQITQETLPPVTVEENSKKITIQLPKGISYELDTNPDRQMMAQALGLTTPDDVRQNIIKSGGVVNDPDPLESYNSMTEENKAKFRETRITFITGVARILHATKFAMGVGSLFGDGFTFIKNNVKQLIGKKIEPKEKVKRSFGLRSEQAVQSILRGLDYKLWYQAPLVIESNEFGVAVSLGLLAETGVLTKGAGGMEELGLSFAYNKTNRAFIFELIHNSENYESSKAAVAVIGVVAKASPTLARRENNKPILGSSFYPPGFPGYTAQSSDFFTAGFSSSFGLPPPPLADVLTYTNSFERRALISISLSPIVKGFIRISIGDFPGTGRLLVARFVDIYKAVNNKLKPRIALSCQSVLTNL